MPGVTHEEVRELLRESRDDLKTYMGLQIGAVNTRLDGLVVQTTAINGRLRDVEGVSKEHGIEIKNLEREVFRPKPTGTTSPFAKGDRKLTERDIKIVSLTLGSIGSVLGFAYLIAPVLKKLLG